MATKATTVEVPSKELKEKLKGFSIAKKSITFKIEEVELGEYAPVVEVMALKNSDMQKVRELHTASKGNEENTGESIEDFIRQKVVSIKVYDVSTNTWETLDNPSVEDYDIVPAGIRNGIITYIFSLNGV